MIASDVLIPKHCSMRIAKLCGMNSHSLRSSIKSWERRGRTKWFQLLIFSRFKAFNLRDIAGKRLSFPWMQSSCCVCIQATFWQRRNNEVLFRCFRCPLHLLASCLEVCIFLTCPLLLDGCPLLWYFYCLVYLLHDSANAEVVPIYNEPCLCS